MPGPWKEWKTKPRYSTLPTVPWKSRIHREISTFPPPRLPAHGKLENQKTVSHFPMRWKRRRLRFPSLLNPNPKKGRRPLRSLLTLPTFRIILYWNQNPVSGSFLDWKMLSYHSYTNALSPFHQRKVDKPPDERRVSSGNGS